MLREFSYLGEEKAYEVVITNPNRIADMCESLRPVPHNLFAPKIENSVEDLKNLVYTKFHRLYGDNPPELMVKRVETELHDIINCHYDVIYMSAQKLVQNSLEPVSYTHLVKKLKKNSEITEDDQKKAEKDLQDLLDKNIKRADAALAAKEKELMAI